MHFPRHLRRLPWYTRCCTALHHDPRQIYMEDNDQLPVGLLAQLIERCTGTAEVMGSNPVRALIFSGLIPTTSSVVFITARIDSIFFFSTAVHIYNFHIFTAIIHHLEGFVWIQHNDQLPTSLLAQLVERSTGIAEVMGSNPVRAWIFSKYEDRFYIRRVIKCYQLSWERKLATAKSLKAEVSSVSDWRRADARSINLQSL